MVTPENITYLDPEEIFIFGSNRRGEHAGGAARLAHEKFGAEWGISEGLTGQCYAFCTLEPEMTKVGQRMLEKQRNRLFSTCRALPEKVFLLTKVGCGIAGFAEKEMIALFKDSPSNLVKPEGW